MNTTSHQKKRIAFMGFRHGHILDLHRLASESAGVEIVAACEEDAKARAQLDSDAISITHTDYATMLDAVRPDIVAVGDYYGKRGAVAIEALRRNCHVISDKPLCTSLSELDRIRTLSVEGALRVGCQLDMRSSGKHLAVRRLIRTECVIGDVLAISFGGQHPLNYGTRPGWYFESGKHGGTINDIAIHALDLIPWVTGQRFAQIHAARNWNTGFDAEPHFRDAAQVMLSLENGCGVLGDVSYLSPTRSVYAFPLYWRFTYWGRKGVIETDNARQGPVLYRDDCEEAECMPPDPSIPGGYFQSFLREIDGQSDGLSPSTAEVLQSSRMALLAQQAADGGTSNVACD